MLFGIINNIIKMKDTEKRQTVLTIEEARNILGRISKDDAMAYFIRANFTEEELIPKTELPKSWKELKELAGYYINTYSKIITEFYGIISNDNRNVFATEKQAKSALAMAQLSQLMKIYNDGWEPDWNDLSIKYTLSRVGNNIVNGVYAQYYNFLTFPNKEIRTEFLKNFEPLIKEYFMID
jgi:hypothetical protein